MQYCMLWLALEEISTGDTNLGKDNVKIHGSLRRQQQPGLATSVTARNCRNTEAVNIRMGGMKPPRNWEYPRSFPQD